MSILTRRRLLQSGAALATAGLARPALGQCLPRSSALTVEHHEVRLASLDPAHDGLRVVQLSDLHVGAQTSPALVREAIDEANRARPDLVVLTGDYLIYGRSGLGRMREQLGGLGAPVVAVLGNHDHWVSAEGAAKELVRHGYACLRNQSTVVTLKGAPFTVAGVDDLMTRHADVGRALAGTRRLSRLVLAHVPHTANQLALHQEEMLVLSGHTHGGQVHIPGLTAALLAVAAEPYERGFYDVGRVRLYVNRGIGTSGIPLRIDSPPEVTVFTLRRQA